MSDIKKRLRALKGKQKVPDAKKPGDSTKRKQIANLKEMITGVEIRRTRVKSPLKTSFRGLLSDDLQEGDGQNIEDLIPGEFCSTPHGECFRVKTVYPWHYYQGDIAINTLLDQNTDCLVSALSDQRLAGIDFTQALFFDTETTGLDTGAGTYIFLAGFGYFDDRKFIVEQYFMRDFPEEPAVMHALEQLLKRFRYIVTYNGKTYDWPLLQTRFIVNRQSLPQNDPPHLDLLTLTRRLYRFRLESCCLTSIEENILGFRRTDDLPGALLPDLYFKYVRSRDARFIHQAFAHNAHDIISLAAIASGMIQFLNNPFGKEDHPAEDIFAFGRLSESANNIIDAKKAYHRALKLGLPRGLYQDALQRLSLIHKRKTEWSEAVKLWEVGIQTGDRSNVFPYEEMSKYYEHQLKDYEKALSIVHQAFDNLDLTGWTGDKIRKELNHRKDRLEAKHKGKKWRINK